MRFATALLVPLVASALAAPKGSSGGGGGGGKSSGSKGGKSSSSKKKDKSSAPSPGDSELILHNYQDDSFPYQIQLSCGDQRKQDIVNGIAEAGYLANQLYQTTPGSAYESNLNLYFGDKATKNYKKLIEPAVLNQFNLHEDVTDIDREGHKIYMVCNPEEENLPRCPGIHTAQTYNVGKDALVVVCGPYFSGGTPSLGEQIKLEREGEIQLPKLDKLWMTKGSIMLQQSFHMKPWIGLDRFGDFENQDSVNGKPIHGPSDVAELAKRRNVEQTALLIDAYVSTAVSSYWQSLFNLKEPPRVTTSISGYERPPDPLVEGYQINQTHYQMTTAQSADFDAYKFFPNDYPGNDCTDGDEKCNFVSSCGSDWMPLADFGGFQGYETAVDKFCKVADMHEVAPGQWGSGEQQVALNGGHDPATSVTEGSLKFEIKNKSEREHFVHLKDCKEHLLKMSQANSIGENCYGGSKSGPKPGNDDTKGGTWQVGKGKISYHALPSKDKKHDELVNKFELH